MGKEDKWGWFGKMAGKVLTSPKFLEFIGEMDLSDLVTEAMQIPGLKEKIVETLTDMSRDIRENYEVSKWDWRADIEHNALIVDLFMANQDMRREFNKRFLELISGTRKKFGGGFDWFMKLYKISNIACHDVEDRVRIIITTPRVRDLQNVILEILTADATYEGGEKR